MLVETGLESGDQLATEKRAHKVTHLGTKQGLKGLIKEFTSEWAENNDEKGIKEWCRSCEALYDEG